MNIVKELVISHYIDTPRWWNNIPQYSDYLRIDRNFCSVHEEISSIRLYTPRNPRIYARVCTTWLRLFRMNRKNNFDQSLWINSNFFCYDIEKHIFFFKIKKVEVICQCTEYKNKRRSQGVAWFSLNEASLGLFKFISDYLPYFEKKNMFFNIITKKVWINS
jgi:hypothetical protein